MLAQETGRSEPARLNRRQQNARPSVFFYVPDENEMEPLSRLDPDGDWQRMRRGQRWVLQTFLRLRESGLEAELTGTPPSGGVLVYHAKHQEHLRKQLNGNRKTTLVGIRGDKKECYLAHFEVVQNRCWADGQRRFFIPYWVQPNLIPRNQLRGTRVENIAFKGFDNNLHPFFFSLQWKDWLRDEGLEWVHHSMPHAPSEEYGVSVDWHDYSKIDVVVACRPAPRRSHEHRGHTGKPATKLYNAWHAGVPAILGPEYAYREVRRSELDYIEIEEPEEVRDALSRLRRDPGLYQAVVENGRKRAAEFDNRQIASQWSELLSDKAQERVGTSSLLAGVQLPHGLRYHLNRLKRVFERRPSR